MWGRPKGGPWRAKILPGITRDVQKELVALGQALYGEMRPNAGYKSEGFAEFLRGWITGEIAVEKVAPKFNAWFEKNILSIEKVGKELHNTRRLGRAWFQMTPEERVGWSMTQIGPAAKRFREAALRARNRFRRSSVPGAMKRALYESGEPIERFAREIERLRARQARERNRPTPEKMAAGRNPYRVFTLLRNAADKRVEGFIKRGVVDQTGKSLGPALQEATQLVRGKEFEFASWLLARWTLKLARKKKPQETGVSIQDARITVESYRSPDFELAAHKISLWSNAVLEYAALASPGYRQIVERIRADDPDGWYIPLLRDFLGDLPPTSGGGRGGGAGGSPFPRRHGSGRAVKNPFLGLINTARRIVASSDRQRVLSLMVQWASILPNSAHLIEEIPRDVAVTRLKIAEIEKALKKKNIRLKHVYEDLGEKIDPNAILSFYDLEDVPTDPRVVSMVDGLNRTRWYFIEDPTILEALGSVDMPVRLHPILQMVRAVGRPMAKMVRAGTTEFVPSFSIMNLLRDFPGMLTNQKSLPGVHRLFIHWLQSMLEAAAGAVAPGAQKKDHFDLVDRIGVGKAQMLSQDISYTDTGIRNLFRNKVQMALDPRNHFNFIRELIQFPEVAPRLAEFKTIARQVGFTNMADFEALPFDERMDKAVEMGEGYRQITGDFGAGGTLTQEYGQLVPFMTSAIQGPRTTLRRLKENPERVIPKILSVIVLPSLYLWWKNKDEEWYHQIPKRQRQLFWHVRIGKDVVRIAKPFEIGQFGSLAEILADTWYRQDPATAGEFFTDFLETGWLGTAFDVVAPPVLPVPAQWAIEHWKNRIDYFDRPIVPESMLLRQVPPEQQYGTFTARAAIVAGEHLGISPYRIEHATRRFFGTLGGDLLHFIAGTGEQGRDIDTGEPSDTPFIGRFFKRGGLSPHQSQAVDELQDAYEQALQRQADRNNPETAEERKRRLILEDAIHCAYLLGMVRSQTADFKKRQYLNWERARCARQALEGIIDPTVLKDLRREAQSLKFEIDDRNGKLDGQERQREVERLTARILLLPEGPHRRELRARRKKFSAQWQRLLRPAQVRRLLQKYRQEQEPAPIREARERVRQARRGAQLQTTEP